MVNLRDVATAALGLAWRGAVPLVGVAILLGMSLGRAPASAPPADVQEPGRGGKLARDEDGTLRVTLIVPEGQANARCLVRDENGADLIDINYNLHGTLFFNLAGSPTFGAAGFRGANGDHGFGVRSESVDFQYAGRPGGPPAVGLYNLAAQRYDWYRVTPEGSLIRDPGSPAR